MNITIARDGQQFGPYTPDQVNSFIASGQLLYSDMALQDGASQWLPLSTVLGVVPPPPPLKPRQSEGRSAGKLVLMTFVWWIVFWIGGLMIVGGIAGALNPEDGANAGGRAGEAFSGLLFLVGLGLSIWLTIAGKLPGTKK